MYPVLGLLPNGVDVVGASLVKPALAVGLGVLMQTGSKPEKGICINIGRR